MDNLFYVPHPGQLELHEQVSEEDTKVVVMETARRWGKGRWALGDLYDYYVKCVHTDYAPASPYLVPPFHAWIVVPSYPQGRQVWNEIVSLFPSQYVASSLEDDWLINLTGSQYRSWGQIEIKSAHLPESLQTVGLDYLWISEAQDVKESAWEKLLPTLTSPERKLHLVVEGIPALYQDHWFRKLYLQAASGAKGYLAHKATAFQNPLLSEEQIQEIEFHREVLREATWRRMYLAEFSSSAGYFTNVDACVSGNILYEPIGLGKRYVGGLDLGRKVDPSVLWIMDAVERKAVYHHAFDTGVNWVTQRETIAHISGTWGLEKLMIDATGLGDVFCDELSEMDVPVNPYIIGSPAARDSLLNTLAVSIEKSDIAFPATPALLRQLRAFQARRQPSGHFRFEAPPGEHDEEVFALALALQACDDPLAVYGVDGYSTTQYMPSDDEVYYGIDSGVERMLQQRQTQKMRERMERAGIL